MTLPHLRLPAPSGPYAVGFLDGTFASPVPGGGAEEISFRCFYPARSALGRPAPYYPDPQMADMQASLPMFEPFGALLHAMAVMPTHGFAQAPVADLDGERFPVLVYSHGYMSFALSNLIQHEELASRGYVVFAMSHPGDAFCTVLRDGSRVGINPDTVRRATEDNMRFMQEIGKSDPDSLTTEEISAYLRTAHELGARVEAWARHTIDAFDEIEKMASDPHSTLHGKLDLRGFGLFGHSLGGASSLHTALLDERVLAAVNLDGWQYGAGLLERTMPVPGLVMATGEHHLPGNFRTDDTNLTYAVVSGSTHWFFCDMAVLAEAPLKTIEPSVTIDGSVMSQLTSDLLSAFFDRHVRGRFAASLEAAAARYPQDVRLKRPV